MYDIYKQCFSSSSGASTRLVHSAMFISPCQSVQLAVSSHDRRPWRCQVGWSRSLVTVASHVWRGFPPGLLQLVGMVQNNAQCVHRRCHSWQVTKAKTRLLHCMISDNGGWSVWLQNSLLVTWSHHVVPSIWQRCRWSKAFSCKMSALSPWLRSI